MASRKNVDCHCQLMQPLTFFVAIWGWCNSHVSLSIQWAVSERCTCPVNLILYKIWSYQWSSTDKKGWLWTAMFSRIARCTFTDTGRDRVCSARISIILSLAAKGTASFGLYLFQRTFNCGSVRMNVLQVPKQVAGPNIHCKNKLQDMHMLIKCCPLIN